MRLQLIFLSFFLSGCVSIRTHELMKIERFQKGQVDIVQRILKDIKHGETLEEIEYNLKGFLDLGYAKEIKDGE